MIKLNLKINLTLVSVYESQIWSPDIEKHSHYGEWKSATCSSLKIFCTVVKRLLLNY